MWKMSGGTHWSLNIRVNYLQQLGSLTEKSIFLYFGESNTLVNFDNSILLFGLNVSQKSIEFFFIFQ